MKICIFTICLGLAGCTLPVDVEKPDITRDVPEVCDHERHVEKFDATSATGCNSDDECVAGPNGRCRWVWHFEESNRVCTYDQCFSDTDCGANFTCSCGIDSNENVAVRADENFCVLADCKIDADCGDYYCKPNHHPCQDFHDTTILGYFCTTENDECVNDSDCSGAFCLFDGEKKKWYCDGYCE